MERDAAKKFFVKDGLLRGYILVDSVGRGGVYTGLIRDWVPLRDWTSKRLWRIPTLRPFRRRPGNRNLQGVCKMVLDAKDLNFKELNRQLRLSGSQCRIVGCCGQRFIAAGMKDKAITIEGIPGNALGAYLNGAAITVNANAQDAVGDTMNDGSIIIHGSIGDAAGYAMRGGRIYVKENAGYRAGIHMKEYQDKVPVMIIGGVAGSFLGEYQAGGIIVVLGLNSQGKRLVGNFPCTGMHGGKMFLRGDVSGIRFPGNVCHRPATAQDLAAIEQELIQYCQTFCYDPGQVLSGPFTLVTPDTKNPYKQMYVAN